MRTPRTMPSRLGPRKPGHSARDSATGAGAVGFFEASGDGDGDADAAGVAVVVAGAAALGAAGCAGSFVVSARSRSSGLLDQRQPNSAW